MMVGEWLLSKTITYLLCIYVLDSAYHVDAAPQIGRNPLAIPGSQETAAHDEIRKVLVNGHARHWKRNDGFCWAL